MLRSSAFWLPFSLSLALFGLFFAWELGHLPNIIPAPARATPNALEKAFAIITVLLLSLDTGLYRWQKKYGSCSVGASRAGKIGGVLGAAALLCPACTIIPFSLLGFGFSLAFLSPFLPLLRIIALMLLCVTALVLWPKNQ